MGVDGFKTDGGERHPDPWFHNLQPNSYQLAALDAFFAFDKSGVTFARSASPPCAGNSTFWAGDQTSNWSELPRVVRAGLSAAMSGFPFWGHDIGGYAGTPAKKLYIRWLELGAFSPIMQLHGTTPREPWYYDDETMRIAKFYFDLRWRLQPYLLAAATQSIERGTPVWRPLAFEFPDDAKTWGIDDEFLLGDELLVAPVLSESDERSVYLPRGTWVDAWTKQRFDGPTQIQMSPRLETIPVFARPDSKVAVLFSTQPGRSTIELAGATNERGIVPTQRIIRGQKYEKIFLRSANKGEVTLDTPAGFGVVPSRTQAGERVAFYVMLPGELAVGSYPVKVAGQTITLVKLPAWPQSPRDDGYVDLGKESESAATFRSEHAGPARLWLGSGDGMTVWLNDEQVFDKQVHRSPERDEDFVDVNVKKGENTLRVKLTHGPAAIGPNGFYLRVE